MHHEVLVVVYRTARTRAREAYAYGHFFTAYDQREDQLFRSKQTNIMRGPQPQLSYQTFNQTHEKILAATCMRVRSITRYTMHLITVVVS
jgi:hypothetical protein